MSTTAAAGGPFYPSAKGEITRRGDSLNRLLQILRRGG